MIYSKTHQGMILVATGTLMFSSKAIIVKILFEYGIGPLELQALRMLMILPFYAVILVWLLRKQGLNISAKEWLACIVRCGDIDVNSCEYSRSGRP